jgi:tetratricopeptide (TPR) repeat protein
MAIDFDPVTASLLREIHRRVGLADDVLRQVLRAHAVSDSDARCHRSRCSRTPAHAQGDDRMSHELLSAGEQRIFCRLSVFVGGCTLEAAEAVCEADLDTLQSVVEKSLLRHSEERYWMLETIREYAAERLEESDETEAMRRRHAEWVLGLAEAAERELQTPKGTAWLDRLPTEMGNVRAALGWAISSDRMLALTLAAALWRFWPASGNTAEALRWLEAAWSDDAPVGLRKRALRALAAIASATYDIPRLIAAADERLELARATSDLEHEVGALTSLAAAAYYADDLSRARRLYEEALRLARKDGNRLRISDILASLGNLARHEGDFVERESSSNKTLPSAGRMATSSTSCGR